MTEWLSPAVLQVEGIKPTPVLAGIPCSKLPGYDPCRPAVGGGVARPPEKDSNSVSPLFVAGTFGTWAKLTLGSHAELKVSFIAAVMCWLIEGVGDMMASRDIEAEG